MLVLQTARGISTVNAPSSAPPQDPLALILTKVFAMCFIGAQGGSGPTKVHFDLF